MCLASDLPILFVEKLPQALRTAHNTKQDLAEMNVFKHLLREVDLLRLWPSEAAAAHTSTVHFALCFSYESDESYLSIFPVTSWEPAYA
ncbi:hypothetical protein O181_047970 [Austropuccinia psidii MF-1]|uniref:Uncharacterized protein n=1 Tax=Austropuccinia psidii MF-1 TaxID=1389203 RepID=A0A9Q3HNQ9_9BASI|nr:hypothetical protein [Austropuccinia psidii MF-1]